MRYTIRMCCRRRKRGHEIITTTMDEKKILQKLIDWGKNPWAFLCEISYCYSVLGAAFIYYFKNIYHPRKRTRKIEKGKKHQIRKRKKTHQIIDIRQSSRLRAVSPFRFSLSRESKKIKKIPPIKLTVALKHHVTSPSLRRRNLTRESQLNKK